MQVKREGGLVFVYEYSTPMIRIVFFPDKPEAFKILRTQSYPFSQSWYNHSAALR